MNLSQYKNVQLNGRDLNSSFAVLPPVGSSSDLGNSPTDTGPPDDGRPLDERALERRAAELVWETPDRAFDNCLIALRRADRERDRVVAPQQMQDMLKKFKIPVDEILDQLQKKFADKGFDGQTNYEDLMRYLQGAKAARAATIRDEEDMERKQREAKEMRDGRRRRRQSEASKADVDSRPAPPPAQQSAFDDRSDARLILELEKALLESPAFDLGRFRAHLEAKDAYDNGQVSRQHVVMAAGKANLKINKSALGMLLQASDPTKAGIYQISLLCNYLERSDPQFLEMRSSASSQLCFDAPSSTTSSSSVRSPPPQVTPAETKVHTVPLWEARQPLQRVSRLSASSSPPSVSGADSSPVPSSPTPSSSSPPSDANLEGWRELQRALAESYLDIPGYLSVEDVLHVCRAYNVVFALGLGDARLHQVLAKVTQQKSAEPDLLVQLEAFSGELQRELQAPQQ